MILYDRRVMEPAPQSLPRARKPSENRDKLIAVARDRMARKGFAATGTEEIVRAAGITRGALYYQFVDKQDLFRAVCESVVADLAGRLWSETMSEVAREEDELRVGLKKLIASCAEPDVRQILLVDGPAVLGMDEWRRIQEPATLGLLRHALGHLVEVGRLSAERVEPVAHLLFGAILQAAVEVGNAADSAHAERVYRDSLALLLDGLEGA